MPVRLFYCSRSRRSLPRSPLVNIKRAWYLRLQYVPFAAPIPSSRPGFHPYSCSHLFPSLLILTQARTASWQHRSSSVFVFLLKSVCSNEHLRDPVTVESQLYVPSNGRCACGLVSWTNPLVFLCLEDYAFKKIIWNCPYVCGHTRFKRRLRLYDRLVCGRPKISKPGRLNDFRPAASTSLIVEVLQRLVCFSQLQMEDLIHCNSPVGLWAEDAKIFILKSRCKHRPLCDSHTPH